MKLVSEQRPNDGGYHVKRLVNEANERLKQKGKQGKRATIVAKKTSLSLQFTYKDGNGRPQKNPGLGGIPVSAKGIEEAERIAELVTAQLTANQFTWEWFNGLIGKDTSEQSKQLTCKEMLEQYKKHYFKQQKGNKTPEANWYAKYRYIERILGALDKSISLSLVRQIVEATENNSNARKDTLNGLAGFFKYFGDTDYKQVIKDYKDNNNPKRKARNVPSDKKIIETHETRFTPEPNSNKRYHHRYPQWQFLYGLLATYGLRVHEAWNIANWDKPVILKNDDWVTVGVDDDSSVEVQHTGEDLIIPAILDPDNKEHLLCIKQDTKTGYRVAFPLSPSGHNWIEEFNLLQPLNLPDIENPLQKTGKNKKAYKCTNEASNWFYRKKYGFTPHDLRHACNHRGHHLGFNSKVLADSLGHSVTMNNTGYLRHMSHEVKVRGMKDALTKEQNKRSELELANERIKELESQLQAKDNEIKMLKAELKLYQTLEESKGKN